MSPVAEVHLFAAARAQLVHEVDPPRPRRRPLGGQRPLPRLVAGLPGRTPAASGVDLVLEANRAAVEGCLPDLSLVIDVEPADTAGRRRARPDRIEAEGDDFLARVAEGYRQVAARFPERVRAGVRRGRHRGRARAGGGDGRGPAVSAAALEIPGQPLAERILRAVLADAHPPQQLLLHGPAGHRQARRRPRGGLAADGPRGPPRPHRHRPRPGRGDRRRGHHPAGRPGRRAWPRSTTTRP